MRSSPRASEARCFAVRAHGSAALGTKELATWRNRPELPPGFTLPASFLKYSDDQSVASLAAVYHALRDSRFSPGDLHEWGVITAGRYVGRLMGAQALHRFIEMGPRSSPPFFASHRSLHSPASTISLALGLRGLHLGVGGGVGHIAEGLLTAATFLQEGRAPGLWVVFTEFTPEPVPTPAGENTLDSVCRAVALACTPDGHEGPGLGWRLVEARFAPEGSWEDRIRGRTLPTVAELAAFLADPTGVWSCASPGVGPVRFGPVLELLSATRAGSEESTTMPLPQVA
jgi:hypothetical protein